MATLKKIKIAAALAVLPAMAMAQSAISAYQLAPNDLRGTARFMSMAGAFTALGGDLSSLNQNPAGIGIYRSSEVGLTLDLDLASSSVDDGIYGGKWKENNTFFACNNFGYIGSVNTNSDVMPYFQWGASYSRVASFDRTFSGSYGSLGTSMSNYIANFSNGYSPYELGQSNNYDPYYDSDADWLSILAYNAYIINPVGSTSQYNGLFNEGVTTGNAEFNVRERGRVDEYSINFGGNFVDMVYWGIGFGITDMSFKQEAFYDEELQNARIARTTAMTGTTTIGNAYYGLSNWRHVKGAGFNFKVGLIVKPINELRFGVSLATPTYYNLTESYDGNIYYSYSKEASTVGDGTAFTDGAYFDWKYRTPLCLNAGIAGVLGGRFIASVDYQLDAYKNMKISDSWGEFTDITYDIKSYYKNVNTIRLGLEYRFSPLFSLRAGWANTFSGVEKDVIDGEEYVVTSGTNPAYTFERSTRYLTAGLGFRSKGFSADLAYVNRHRSSTYQPFSSYSEGNDWWYAPYSDFTSNDNHIVLSLSYRF